MKSYDIEHTIRVLITRRVRAYVQGKGNINQLSVKSGLSRDTISRLAYMETKYPRMHTIVALMDTLGLKLSVTDNEAIVPVEKINDRTRL